MTGRKSVAPPSGILGVASAGGPSRVERASGCYTPTGDQPAARPSPVSDPILTEAGRDALIDAALRGVRQIKGRHEDGDGGHCALGVLAEVDLPRYGCVRVPFSLVQCPACHYVSGSVGVIAHCNDLHGWDFLTIARKLG